MATEKYSGGFHAERVVDGIASALTALTLYEAGTTTTFTLDSKFRLVITDIYIKIETAGDFALLADSAAGGKYLAEGHAAADTTIVRQFRTPYVCAAGVVPKFQGPATEKSVCLVEGYIIEA